ACPIDRGEVVASVSHAVDEIVDACDPLERRPEARGRTDVASHPLRAGWSTAVAIAADLAARSGADGLVGREQSRRERATDEAGSPKHEHVHRVFLRTVPRKERAALR